MTSDIVPSLAPLSVYNMYVIVNVCGQATVSIDMGSFFLYVLTGKVSKVKLPQPSLQFLFLTYSCKPYFASNLGLLTSNFLL